MRGIQWFGLVALVVLGGCNKAPTGQPAPQAPSVGVTTIAEEPVTYGAEYVGRTQASEDVTIQAQVSGPMLKRHFVEGDEVKQGQLLFEIDPSPYLAERGQQLAQLTQAEAARDVAILNWERGKQLFPDGMISAKDMDALTSDKLQTEAQVVQAKSALEAAELQLSYTKVTAPIDGKISTALVSQGDLVDPQQTLATLVRVNPFWVTFQVSSRELSNAYKVIRTNPDALPRLEELVLHIRLPNGDQYAERGGVDYVANRVDAATGTVEMRAQFPNPDDFVLPGMFVTVVIEAPETEQALLVPQAAVQQDQQGRYVFVIGADNKAEKRLVSLGQQFGIKWEVKAGLNPGDRVVTEGLQKIRPGVEVTATEATVQPFEAEGQEAK
ncbi:efflux RND transporter periplasmic adaptor subunit [Ferrimonas sp. SCSIO 43195]|uniref:efflux RND transporter periplasmic adaptor subunit n=1 Tax=Ferrimonas sp. SCSIO 43195 TaxID=2822844 RepID=UPI002076359F|nr:efflux RND transporter periplasmic adaptor subunit [Ferrimonas sp. SCSIO 43195]USD38291.1 efflux RND transporter periplasmic adaptor subunit [Ferrimonas sp. SCSIO 43195]